MHAHLRPTLFSFTSREVTGEPEKAGGSFYIRETGFQFDYRENYTDMIADLCADKVRNHMIVDDILCAASRPGSHILVVSERIDHLEGLRKMLADAYFSSVEILNGTTGEKKREAIGSQVNIGKIKGLLTALKSGGGNCKAFRAMIIACPVKSGDLLAQAIGGLLPGSEIFDYRDAPLC